MLETELVINQGIDSFDLVSAPAAVDPHSDCDEELDDLPVEGVEVEFEVNVQVSQSRRAHQQQNGHPEGDCVAAHQAS